MKHFPTHVLRMGVQKLKLRCRVELFAENGGELIEYFYIQFVDLILKKKRKIFCLHLFLF
jgi:hypothetical protein